MNEGVKLATTLVFIILAILLGLRFFKTKGKVKIKDSQPKMMIYLVDILITLMVISTIFTYQTNTFIDYIRLVFTIIVIILFYNLHDGVGDEGVSIQGNNYTWEDINSWDYSNDEKNTTIYFQMYNQKMNKNNKIVPKMINFTKDNGEEALKVIKEHVPKKFKRMRK